jgi:hypothetical protein
MNKHIPVFDIDFTDESIWNNISIVDFPAIEEDFIKMSKQAEIKFSINEEKRDIMGPVLIPDKLIYRNDARGEYYIKFSAETIKKMAIDFFQDNIQNSGNIMHRADVDGITFYQSFIKDANKGINPASFEDVPDGSWFVTAHVANDDVWNLIKKGELRGFSIDCTAAFKEEEDVLNSLEDFVKYLNNK